MKTKNRILIAEDNLTSRLMLKSVLQKKGFEVDDAADGNEAWTKAHEPDAPRLLILDWLMPGKNGTEICSALKAEDHDVPFYIILLTSKHEKEDVVEGLSAGADDFISKPFDSGELQARVSVGFRMIDLQMKLCEKISSLQLALEQINTLHGLLPMCMHCHKVRDDQGYWDQLEHYIRVHELAEITHGICPDCLQKHYPEIHLERQKSCCNN